MFPLLLGVQYFLNSTTRIDVQIFSSKAPLSSVSSSVAVDVFFVCTKVGLYALQFFPPYDPTRLAHEPSRHFLN